MAGIMDAQHQKESCCDTKFSITGGTKGNCYGNLKCHQRRQNIQENAFENIVFKMLAILFKPQCVKRGPFILPVIVSLMR